MCMTRSAIILYSKIYNKKLEKYETYILLGNGEKGITSIGGRAKKNENKFLCAAREAKEE